MSTPCTRAALAATAILSCSLLGACVAALPITADVAGAALEKGPDVAKAGKVQSHQPVSIGDMTAYARQAANELDLKQTSQNIHPDSVKLHYQDQKKQDIAVTLTKRTDKVTEVQVDVGWFGDAGMAQLMLRQIMHDLPPEAIRTSNQSAASNSPSGR